MNMAYFRSTLVAAVCVIIAGCAHDPKPPADVSDDRAIRDRIRSQTHVPQQAIAQDKAVVEQVAPESGKLFSFVARDLPIGQACRLFGKTYDLNIVVDKDVTGTVSVDLLDLPFSEVMESLLGANGYYWERRGNIVYVKSWETRTFAIDYIRLVRSGSGSSQAQVSSSADSDGGDDKTAGTMMIQQADKVDFWSELEEQLKTLISEKGRLLVNRLSGTIQVTDQHQRVEELASFIEQLNGAIYRQVDIDVRIVEVALNDDSSLGIDWSRMVRSGDGEFVGGNLSTIIVSPAGGQPALPPTVGLAYSNIENGLNSITGVLEALQEHGDVTIVSQPHIRTLNNQSALIKVGTDRTFFRKEQLTDATSAGSQTFSTDVPQVVTEGIVLSITPQISRDGWITLDVSPVVTRVSSVSEVLDDNGNVQSTAPNLDISQASSLVRARSGETIVIGGLIQDQETETIRSIPGLGSVPVVGRLFRSNYKATAKKELIMLVTPRIISE